MLPSFCEKHPDAKIRHEWNRTQYIMNQLPAGRAQDHGHQYFCAECGTEVCSEAEYEARQK